MIDLVNFIFPNILTHEDRLTWLRKLEDAKSAAYKNNSSTDQIIKEYGLVDLKTKNNFSSADLIKLIDNLVIKINSWPQVRIETSSVMSRDLIKKISELIDATKNNHYIIETKINPEILGGLYMYIDNNFIDLSLSTKIENFLQSEEFNNLLKNYL